MDRQIVIFGKGFDAAPAADASVLGAKGADLAAMAAAGIPVPATAIIPVTLTDQLLEGGEQALARFEAALDAIAARFSLDGQTLLAVRLSPVNPVPGLGHSFLGLGQTQEGFAAHTVVYGDAFAWRKRRQMIAVHAEAAFDAGPELFEEALEDLVDAGASERALCARVEEVYERIAKRPFTAGRNAQLLAAISALLKSWNGRHAAEYRALHGLPSSGGLAVILQKQVLHDAVGTGCAGHCTTRSLADGSRSLHGFWQTGAAQDRRLPLASGQPEAARKPELAMDRSRPDMFERIRALGDMLEQTFHDAQSFEFVAGEDGVFVMSTMPAKTGVKAALRIACDLVKAGIVTPRDALMRIDPSSLDQLIHRSIDPNAARDVIASGLAASPGAATGLLVFSAAEAAARRAKGEATILFRTETSPEDVAGMAAADGIVTARGGLTSHAAVVARGMGKPCVTGASALQIDAARRTLVANGRAFAAGQIVTIDGSTGEVLAGAVPTVLPEISQDFATVLGWADAERDLGIRANADMPLDASTARGFGAEGIGLCRTEHMFFQADRVAVMREMILADSPQARSAALERLGPMQRQDFEDLFRVMAGMPVTLRLLDPPLHEFLPNREQEFVDTARALGVDVETLRIRVEAMREVNPMLGHRGCRLAISHPEILDMQARAIFEAAMNVEDETGRAIAPEIMIPFVCAAEEVRVIGARIAAMAATIESGRGRRPAYSVGTMIELPRAALGADRIARECTFFSFGTNDLTQTTYGISRDDSSPFLALYRERRVFKDDPFQTFDALGAGELMRIACEKGRHARPELKLAVCGEHGGEPASIAFFDSLGIDYISCSPYRVPIARLAAAQAAIRRRAAKQALQ
jgi:pyruvate, orthophosphate dikinase